jgi:hypothetical protein
MLATRWPAISEPANSQFFLPMAMGRMAFSTGLLSMGRWALAVVGVAREGAPAFERVGGGPGDG